jgi:hypothetical protein
MNIVTRLLAGESGVRIPVRLRNFSPKNSRPVTGPNDPPIQRAPAFLPGRNEITKLQSHLHLVARIRMSGAIYLYSSIYIDGIDRENFVNFRTVKLK